MEKRKKLSVRIILLIAGLIFLPVYSYTQVIGIVDYAIFDESQAIIGDTTIITIHVKFKSSVTNNDTAVNGNLYYHYQTDSMIAAGGMGNIESIDDSPGWEIVPVGGKFDTIQFPCRPNQLRTGPVNVIIIWPALFNPLTPMDDSVMYILTNVSVGAEVGIIEEGLTYYGSTAYPNPAMGEQLVMIHSPKQEMIQSISILNSVGQILSNQQIMEGQGLNDYILPTNKLSPGVYIIQLGYTNRQVEIIKFIKN
jgi:hypothetical protein